MTGEHRLPGRLYVVATPIGNLGDITLRALEVLRRVPLVAAEDTRHTRKLLTHFLIRTRLLSYHAHNRRSRAADVLDALSAGDVALVSDAGTPVISDPGQELVRAAAGAGHEVVVIPGPSALTAAVAVSGIDASVMHFAGFLPRRAGERRRALERVARWGAGDSALTIFEAPHRLVATLAAALDVFGDQPVAVCCELTKRFEKVTRASLSEALAHYRAHKPRGEFTLVLTLPSIDVHQSARATSPPVELEARFAALIAAHGGDRKRALSALAVETHQPRKELYARLVSGRAPG
ncbi:MAG: 16S rRNA (cytidine(1402)-2'-O)-methyltransferase [Chloroflexota bacterium]